MDYRIKQLLGKGRRIIDLGCGSGAILSELADNFEERIGLDISQVRLKEKKGGVGSSMKLT